MSIKTGPVLERSDGSMGEYTDEVVKRMILVESKSICVVTF